MKGYIEATRDNYYLGLRSDVHSDDLPEGFGQVVDNLVLAQRGLRVRPPKTARLTAALAAPIWNAYPFQKTDGTWASILAVGGASGEIRQWNEDDATTTLLSSLGTFDAPNTQFVRIGDYLFLKGAADGVIRRTNLTTFESVTGAVQPAYTAAAKLSTDTIFGLTADGIGTSSDTDWNQLSVTDDDFAASVHAPSSVTAPANFGPGWYAEVGVIESDDNIDPANLGDYYVRMDEPDSQIATRSDALIAVGTKINLDGDPLGTGVATRYHTHFKLGFRYKTDYGLSDSLFISMVALDNSGNPLAEVTQEYSVSATGVIYYSVLEFSFVGLVDETVIRNVGVRIKAGPSNQPGGTGPYISFIQVYEFIPDLYFTPDGDGAIRMRTPIANFWNGITDPPSFDSSTVPVGDQHIVMRLGASTDFDTTSRVAIAFTPLIAGIAPACRLGFRSGANEAAAQSATVVYTPVMNIGEAANGQKFFFTDLSVLTPAQRQDVWYIDFHFTKDIQIEAGTFYTGQEFMSLGPLIEVGNLTVGQLPYTYRLRERLPNGGGSAFLTSPTILASGVVEPTVYQAQAMVSVPTTASPFPQNDSAAPGSPIELWRSGGNLGAQFYFVGVAPDGLANATGEYWSYDAATRTFYDNTPDQILERSDILLDHVAPPTFPDCIGEHANRLVVCQGEQIWVAQATLGVETGMYFTEVFDPTHPRWREMGWTRRLTGGDGQSTRREPLAILSVNEKTPVATSPDNLARSVIITRGSPYFLAGTQPPFLLTSLNFNLNVGAVNHRACTLFDGLVFAMTSDGLRAFNLSQAIAASQFIEGNLNPDDLFLSAGLDTTALRESFLFESPGRLLLAVPAPSSVVVDKVYLLDKRYADPPGGAWTRHGLGRITSGFTLRGDRDAATYLCDYGGQLYRWDGSAVGGDTATRGGAASAIPIQFDSRNFGGDDNDLRCQRLSALFEAGGNQAITISVIPNDNDTLIDSHAWNLVSGENVIDRLTIDQKATGRQIKYRITGNITVSFSIRRVFLHTTPHRAI